MNYSYGSQTVTLVSQKNKHNNFKMNVNTTRKTKNPSQLASLVESPLNFMSMCSFGKINFSTEVGDKLLTDKYSDQSNRLFLRI